MALLKNTLPVFSKTGDELRREVEAEAEEERIKRATADLIAAAPVLTILLRATWGRKVGNRVQVARGEGRGGRDSSLQDLVAAWRF